MKYKILVLGVATAYTVSDDVTLKTFGDPSQNLLVSLYPRDEAQKLLGIESRFEIESAALPDEAAGKVLADDVLKYNVSSNYFVDATVRKRNHIFSDDGWIDVTGDPDMFGFVFPVYQNPDAPQPVRHYASTESRDGDPAHTGYRKLYFHYCLLVQGEKAV